MNATALTTILQRLLLAILILPLTSNLCAGAELRFGLYNWPPFSFVEERENRGIDVDLAREIAREIGITFSIRTCPFKRCLTEMAEGQLDLMSGIARTPEREAYMNYAPSAYSAVNVVFIVRAGDELRLRRYEDLSDLRIGQVVKAHYFDRFNDDGNLEKLEVPHEKLLPKMLHIGRIDTFVSHDITAAHEILVQGYKGRLIEAPYSPGNTIPVYFAVSKKSPHQALQTKLEQAIQHLLADGTVARIHAKYR